MRLLQHDDDGGLSLVEFIGDSIPPYAILSHTWSQTSTEVSFAAFMSDEDLEDPKYSESYGKILRCGEQAKRDGLEYFWVDTCCINKDSSAELLEAINSMYAWYKNADTCYAYLSDVHEKSKFHESHWFERGWTLQELLAPADVVFFDASWSTVGFKTSLIQTLSRYTGIHTQALSKNVEFNEFGIAERMSWAASRQTTRSEDEAYCLMGLFDVNMPLIYGEGRRAFIRLQEEILKSSNDSSILAYFACWCTIPRTPTETDTVSALYIGSRHSEEAMVPGTMGLFADSPSLFSHSVDYISHSVLNEIFSSHEASTQTTRV